MSPPRYTFPGHKYLGPGNTLENGEPIDEDDYIARQHDREYQNAKNFEDIKRADSKAIGSFGRDFISTGNFHSAVGAIGLGIKSGTERLLNRQLYPSVSGTSKDKPSTSKEGELTNQYRKIDGNDKLGIYINGKFYNSHAEYEASQKKPGIFGSSPGKGQGPAKRQRTINKNLRPVSKNKPPTNNMEVDPDLLEAEAAAGLGGNSRAGVNTGGAPGSGMRGQTELPSGLPITNSETVVEYSKEYFFRIKNQLIEIKNTTGTVPYKWARFPIHDIPVNMLGFYLSKDEISKIVSECSEANVVECYVEIYNDTATLPFATNQSVTSVGNNNVGIELLSFQDLMRHRQGTLPPQHEFITRLCWGQHFHELVSTGDWSPTGVGALSAETVQKDLDNRFEYRSAIKEEQDTIHSRGCKPTEAYSAHIFPIWRFVKKRINASMNEGLFETWSYKPKNGKIAGRHWLTGNPGYNPGSSNYDMMYPSVHLPAKEETNGAGQTTNLQNISTIDIDRLIDDPNRSQPKTMKMPWLNVTDLDYKSMQVENTSESGVLPPTCCIGMFPLATGQPATGMNQLAIVDAYIKLHVRAHILVREVRGTTNMFRNCKFDVDTKWKWPIVQPIFHHPNFITVERRRDGLIDKMRYEARHEDSRGIPVTYDYATNIHFTTGINDPTRDTTEEEVNTLSEEELEVPPVPPRKYKKLFINN